MNSNAKYDINNIPGNQNLRAEQFFGLMRYLNDSLGHQMIIAVDVTNFI